jgi:hypothetical protein
MVGCSVPNEINSPGEALLEKLEERLENSDYRAVEVNDNPFQTLGKQVADFKQKVEKDKLFLQKFHKEKRKTIEQASIFDLIADDTDKLGIEDPELLDHAKVKVQEFTEDTGHSFNEQLFFEFNSALLAYPANRSGVNEMVGELLKGDGLSEIQRNIGRQIVEQVDAAGDLTGQLAVIVAIERDVNDSQIEKADKDFLLGMCAIFKEELKNELSQGHFKKTAVAFVAVGAAVFGAMLAIIVCDGGCSVTGTTCPVQCWLPAAGVGAAFGAFVMVVLISNATAEE